MGKTRTDYGCSLELSMDLVGGKWKMVILWRLRSVTLRFGELRHQLPGITQKMLTQQLREQEEAGLVCRKAYAVVPPAWNTALPGKGWPSYPLSTPCAFGPTDMPESTALLWRPIRVPLCALAPKKRFHQRFPLIKAEMDRAFPPVATRARKGY